MKSSESRSSLVSGLIVLSLIDTAAAAGAPSEGVLQTLGLERARLRAPDARVPWETFVATAEALSTLMGREAFLASAELYASSLPDFAPVARLFVKPLALLRFVYEVANAAAFPMLDLRVEQLDTLRFCIDIHHHEGTPPSELVWAYCERGARSVPNYLGLPKATTRLRTEGARGWIEVDFPPVTTAPAFSAESLSDSAVQFIEGLGLSLVRVLSASLEYSRELEQRTRALEGVISQLISEMPNAAYFAMPGEPVQPANASAVRRLQRGGAIPVNEFTRPGDESAYRSVPLLGDRKLLIERKSYVEAAVMDEVRSRLDRLDLAFQAIPLPVALLDVTGRVLNVSALARRLLGGSGEFSAQTGKLALQNPQDASAFEAALRRASAAPPMGRRHYLLKVGDSGRPMSMVLIPIQRWVDEDAASEMQVLVVFQKGGPEYALNTNLLSELHGLTTTEAEVAAAIAAGESLKDIALARGPSEPTLRSHLKRIFAKTHTRRQADLVRLLLSSAAIHLVSLDDVPRDSTLHRLSEGKAH